MKYILIFLMFSSVNINHELTIQITDLRSNDGDIKISVFNKKNGFPDKYKEAIKTYDSKINNKESVLIIDIPYGEYAISAFHDENLNSQLDTHFFIPVEGVASSNNPQLKFGPPKYDDSKFIFSKDNNFIILKIIYIK